MSAPSVWKSWRWLVRYEPDRGPVSSDALVADVAEQACRAASWLTGVPRCRPSPT